MLSIRAVFSLQGVLHEAAASPRIQLAVTALAYEQNDNQCDVDSEHNDQRYDINVVGKAGAVGGVLVHELGERGAGAAQQLAVVLCSGLSLGFLLEVKKR